MRPLLGAVHSLLTGRFSVSRTASARTFLHSQARCFPRQAQVPRLAANGRGVAEGITRGGLITGRARLVLVAVKQDSESSTVGAQQSRPTTPSYCGCCASSWRCAEAKQQAVVGGDDRPLQEYVRQGRMRSILIVDSFAMTCSEIPAPSDAQSHHRANHIKMFPLPSTLRRSARPAQEFFMDVSRGSAGDVRFFSGDLRGLRLQQLAD